MAQPAVSGSAEAQIDANLIGGQQGTEAPDPSIPPGAENELVDPEVKIFIAAFTSKNLEEFFRGVVNDKLKDEKFEVAETFPGITREGTSALRVECPEHMKVPLT